MFRTLSTAILTVALLLALFLVWTPSAEAGFIFHRHSCKSVTKEHGRCQCSTACTCGSSCPCGKATSNAWPTPMPSSLPPACPNNCPVPKASKTTTTTVTTVTLESELLGCFNAERSRVGLAPLVLDAALNTAARAHSAVNAARNRLFHDPAAGKGEIIAWNFTSASDVTGGWMRSSGHREVMLTKSYTKVGFGRTGQYWCARFN